eukprot:Skav205189  [mRNA]  locus=scaffold300:126380:141359:- [translate_table: standard]
MWILGHPHDLCQVRRKGQRWGLGAGTEVKTETGKATTFLEREDEAFYRRHLQSRSSSLGVITSGGTAANIQALWMARHRLFPEAESKGFWLSCPSSPSTNQGDHPTASQAMSLLGLGSDNLMKVDCEAQSFRVDVEKMRRTAEIFLEKNFKAGPRGIMAVVGLAGATETGSVDDLDALADLALSVGAHFHVDAAWGFPLTLRDQRGVPGMERADTVAVDGHKLFTLEGSRPAMAIYLHMNLRCLGRQGLLSRVERGCALAQRLAQMLSTDQSCWATRSRRCCGSPVGCGVMK